MSWLGKLFRLGVAERQANRPGAVLPEELLTALASRRLELVSPALRTWCKANRAPESINLLLSAAKSFGWSGDDLDKLEIFFEFYVADPVKAFERARRYVSTDRFDADLFVICMLSLYQNNQFEDAREFLRSAEGHEVLADRWDYWFGRSLILWAANDMAGLKEAVDRMCALSPDDVTTLENACGMYLELGDMTRFEELRKKLREGEAEPGYAYALNSLAIGNYEEGFRRMEARYDMEEAFRYLNRALFDLPRWRGEDLAGKTLLVSAEQGLGDTIQMARYLPSLLALPAARVVMETQAPTMSLLQFNFPEIEFVVRAYAQRPPLDFDLWVGSMSLPYLCSTKADNVPGRAGYLHVPPENAVYWRERVSTSAKMRRPKIGLAWSGQNTHRGDRRRSIPFALMMKTIQPVDADFFAIQTTVPEGVPGNLLNVSEEMVTLADTAALIAEMDLIITVDTSVVHIAGAIAKETWLLLPYRYEWRWGFEGEDNRWYDSVHVLRQSRHGEWAGLLEEVFGQRLPEWRKSLGRER